MKFSAGFTLVELLVVIAIMAITGVYVLSNYSSFGEDQKLKNAVLDIQNHLRAAQANATTNARCNTGYGATWQVEFADTKTINTSCQEPSASPAPKKVVTLDANTTQAVSGTNITGGNCSASTPFTINFAPISGRISLIGGTNCVSFMTTLTNTKVPTPKSLIIEQGGRIYAN